MLGSVLNGVLECVGVPSSVRSVALQVVKGAEQLHAAHLMVGSNEKERAQLSDDVQTQSLLVLRLLQQQVQLHGNVELLEAPLRKLEQCVHVISDEVTTMAQQTAAMQTLYAQADARTLSKLRTKLDQCNAALHLSLSAATYIKVPSVSVPVAAASVEVHHHHHQPGGAPLALSPEHSEVIAWAQMQLQKEKARAAQEQSLLEVKQRYQEAQNRLDQTNMRHAEQQWQFRQLAEQQKQLITAQMVVCHATMGSMPLRFLLHHVCLLRATTLLLCFVPLLYSTRAGVDPVSDLFGVWSTLNEPTYWRFATTMIARVCTSSLWLIGLIGVPFFLRAAIMDSFQAKSLKLVLFAQCAWMDLAWMCWLLLLCPAQWYQTVSLSLIAMVRPSSDYLWDIRADADADGLSLEVLLLLDLALLVLSVLAYPFSDPSPVHVAVGVLRLLRDVAHCTEIARYARLLVPVCFTPRWLRICMLLLSGPVAYTLAALFIALRSPLPLGGWYRSAGVALVFLCACRRARVLYPHREILLGGASVPDKWHAWIDTDTHSKVV